VRAIHRALLHGAIALAMAPAVLRLAARRPALAGAVALVATTADLALANAPLVITIPQDDLDWRNTPRVLRILAEAERADPAPGPYRVHRMAAWGPLDWLQAGSVDRVREFVRWERDTIQPKYAIPYGLQYTLTEGTTELYDYWWFFGPFRRRVRAEEAAAALHVALDRQVVYYPRRGFDLWNTRYFVLPVDPRGWDDEDRGYAAFLPGTTPVYPRPGAFDGPGGTARRRRWVEAEDFQVLRNEAAFPRAWVVHEAVFIPPIRGLAKADRVKTMYEILYQDDALWHDPTRRVYDPRRLAWIETDDATALASFLSRTAPGPSETVAVSRYEPRRVELRAHLDRPGLVILADVFYPGWTLTIDGRPAPILRANRLMRGAAVGAGTHRLVYSYRPVSFRLGVLVSLGGLAAAAALGLRSRRDSRRKPEGGAAPPDLVAAGRP
jgi:Bacterial membrane protein YfhO